MKNFLVEDCSVQDVPRFLVYFGKIIIFGLTKDQAFRIRSILTNPEQFIFLVTHLIFTKTIIFQGYAVHGLVRDNCNVLGLSVTIMSQEDKNPMPTVDKKIEDFVMEKMADILEKMTEEEFETNKQSLIKLKMVLDTDLKAEFDRNWGEISSQDYLFDRREREIEHLANLKKSDILEFYKKYVQVQNVRKLSVQVIGCVEELPACDAVDHKPVLEILTDRLANEENIIKDIAAFKKSLDLFPVLKTKLN